MTKQGTIYTGIGGWTYEPWRGVFYPKGLPHARELEYAAQHLTSIEVNGTFYRTQTPKTFRAWASEAPDGFVFSLKGPRYAVNRRVLSEAGDSIKRFLESGITELGPKLGPLLWQFAPTKKFDAADFGRFLAHASANVRQHIGALGTDVGKGVMSVPMGRYGLVTGRSFLTGRNTGLGSNDEFQGQVEVVVEVETLDGFAERNGITTLDFLKIDVEGAELMVLESGQHVIERHRPAMLVEIEARHLSRFRYTPSDIVDWLVKRDYAMYVWRDGWRPADTVTEANRNYLFRPTL